MEQALKRERARLEQAHKPLAYMQGYGAGEHDMNPYPRGDRHRSLWADGHAHKLMIIDQEKAR